MGGGFPNTELREVNDPRVFEFFDFITLDDGELPVELIFESLKAENPEFKQNTAFGRDMLNVAVGIVWQTALVAAPIYLVVKQFWGLAIAAIIVGIGTVILKKNWYDKLED